MFRNDFSKEQAGRGAKNHPERLVKFLLICAFLLTQITSAYGQVAPPFFLPPPPPMDHNRATFSAEVNQKYTPLMLPQDAAARGISLSGGAQLWQDGVNHFHIMAGCILVHAKEAIKIRTCRAEISALKGATMVISCSPDVTRVLNLSDRKRGSVKVIMKDRYISLNPGEEFSLVYANAPSPERIAIERDIRFRKLEIIAVSSEYKAVLFDFSLGDALRHCLIFKQLKESPYKADKALLAEIIKTAAAVNTEFAYSRPAYKHEYAEAVASATGSHQLEELNSRLTDASRGASERLLSTASMTEE